MKRTGFFHLVTLVLLSFALLTFFSVDTGQAAANKNAVKKVNKLLKKIKSYDYGDSKERLQELSDVLRQNDLSPQDLLKIEQGFIKFLDSKATLASKQFICKKLSIIGTEASVPTLSRMLVDAKTSDMARYALERIPGEKVNEALRNALPKTEGKVRIGIINSLGVRRDTKAVSTLVPLVNDADAGTAMAAIAALGRIGGQQAIEALSAVVDKASGQVRITALDALLQCADQLVEAGRNDQAIAIYKQLDGPDVPFAIRNAAFRGLFNTDKDNAGRLVYLVIKNGDPEAQKVAFQLLRQVPEKDLLVKVAKLMHGLSPQGRVQLVTAFGDIGDPVVLDVVSKTAKCKYKNVRLASLRALANLGNASTVMLLAKAAANSSGDERKVAEESLTLLKGDDINQSIVDALANADAKVKIVLISSLAGRDARETVPTLLETAKDEDARVRRTALKVLGQLAGPEYLPQLIDLLVNAQTQAERNEGILTVTAVCHRIPDAGKQAELVLQKLPQVQEVEARVSLLRVLGKVGDKNALPVLRQALQDENEEVQAEAIRALSDWPSDEPMADLLNIVRTSQNPDHRALALEGYIKLIRAGDDRPEKETIAMYMTAMQLAKDVGEKRMILSGLGELKSPDALKTAQKFLTDKEIQPEAEMAVYQIARKLRRDNPKLAKKALKKVLAITENESLRQDAGRELKRIK